ncbi:MAG: hypothetical protein CSB44_04065 [Gammaproteobacteria bacterium]|nr:MAG: hypothetical protein CSB44_04065 [Gammaproteobacteria bacterium]
MRDLREFIAALEGSHARDFLSVDTPLSGRHELAAVTGALAAKMRVPVIVYRSVSGTAMPVVHNVCASMQRIAKAAGIDRDALQQRLATAESRLLPPTVLEKPDTTSAPVLECVFTGEALDLGTLPAILHDAAQQEPYINAAQVVARDPESGACNLSFHRLMHLDAHELAICMTPGGHLRRIFEHNRQAGRDTPIGMFIGAHPLWSLGALAGGSLDSDEYAVTGGLLGQPIELIRGRVHEELLLPARAEILLEGTISCRETADEGPYGEAMGYVSDRKPQPVVHVEVMAQREGALYQDIVPGQHEHLTMSSTMIELPLRERLGKRYPAIVAMAFDAPMSLQIALGREGAPDPGALIREILAKERFVKRVVVFADDVDLADRRAREAALSLMVQGDSDIVVVPDQHGSGVDPSERDGRTAKWGIDATGYGKAAGKARRNRLPEHLAEAMNLDALVRSLLN